jgi:hypothetical protein
MNSLSGERSALKALDGGLQPLHMDIGDRGVSGDRQFTAQIEQVVLRIGEDRGAQASGSVSDSSKPSVEFNSSTAPMASMRGESLATREPSPRPVVPASPVRVTIFDNL